MVSIPVGVLKDASRIEHDLGPVRRPCGSRSVIDRSGEGGTVWGRWCDHLVLICPVTFISHRGITRRVYPSLEHDSRPAR